FLDGIELSVFVLTDGQNYLTLPTAKDYKRIGEGDTGLNTGGMGAVSPVPFADSAFMQKVEERVIKPTINGLKAEEIAYKGFIFIGLIKIDDDPYVIEYNVRMGDPETEAVLPRIKNDLVEVFTKVGEQKLNEVMLDLDERAAATVMLVSGGYPEGYEKGKVIHGMEKVQDALVFQAGTRLENGEVLTNGGRVMAITALDIDFKQALKKAYTEVEKISFEGMNYRKDIGFDL
ncbi:MAG TPA: phosphoribosylamine--glycine ligase, partial [Leeuwenhoekiella sp.]|nr:phosphoribosylamine--glycine ligase [Leeuwenhoekiella sp.]